ncbi:hypothetical protein HT031_005181 [Scenedesmus sp. PABB004]|nr:hypothetical protein HT031_005181 [Scenedesmus sp. PABB004]
MQAPLRGGRAAAGAARPQPAPAAARLRRRAVAAATQQQQPHQQEAQELSMVLLASENLRRRLGRGLVPPAKLLAAVDAVDAADLALLLLGHPRAADGAATPVAPVLFANGAALSALGGAAVAGRAALQQLVLPAAVADALQRAAQAPPAPPAPPSTTQPQPQAAPPAGGCALLHDVAWPLPPGADSAGLTVPQLLVCPVCAPNDEPLGAALLFDAWRHDDGRLGVPGWPAVPPGELPTAQALQAAADAVRAQADAVRQLKQGQGLGNKEPAVVEAVARLQALKASLGRLEGLRGARRRGAPGAADG